MLFIAIFVTTLCVLFLVKLRWPKEKKLRSIFFSHLHSVLLSNPSCKEGPVLTGGGMEVYYLGRGGVLRNTE